MFSWLQTAVGSSARTATNPILALYDTRAFTKRSPLAEVLLEQLPPLGGFVPTKDSIVGFLPMDACPHIGFEGAKSAEREPVYQVLQGEHILALYGRPVSVRGQHG